MKDEKPFFIGYIGLPGPLRALFAILVVALLAGSVGFAAATAFTQEDPGPARFRFDLGRQTVTGVVELTPTPLLHVTEGSEHVPAGRTLMLSGQGKNGLLTRATPLDGQMATVSGTLLNRGTLEMMQLRGGRRGLAAAEDAAPAPVPEPVSLGRWRLAGEICDGKCTAGAMHPGRGLAHKACANLCILNGMPPVFVTTAPIEGSEYLLIAGDATGPMPEALYDWVAEYVVLEGEITRHGDLLVLTVDPETVEHAP